METIRRIKIIDVLKREDYGSEVNVKGWVLQVVFHIFP